MRRLVLLVVGVRNEYRGEPIEAYPTVRSGVIDMPRLARPGQLQVVGVVVECPGGGTAQDVGVERGVGETGPQAPAKARSDVADPAQLLPDPAFFKSAPDLCAGISREPPKHGLGRDHPGFHRGVASFDLGHIDETGSAANQRAARKIEKRNRLQTALIEGSCPIGDAPPAREEGPDRGMSFKSLKFLERVQKRVLIIQADHKTDSHLSVFEMIEERTAIGATIKRPA